MKWCGISIKVTELFHVTSGYNSRYVQETMQPMTGRGDTAIHRPTIPVGCPVQCDWQHSPQRHRCIRTCVRKISSHFNGHNLREMIDDSAYGIITAWSTASIALQSMLSMKDFLHSRGKVLCVVFSLTYLGAILHVHNNVVKQTLSLFVINSHCSNTDGSTRVTRLSIYHKNA